MSRHQGFSSTSVSSRLGLAGSCALLALVAVAACGGTVQSTDARDGGGTSGGTSGATSGGTSGATSGGGTSGTTTSGGSDTLSARCPASAPPDGSACSSGAGVTCEYGGQGPFLACATVARCGADAKWSTRIPDATCKGVQSANESACPSSYAALGAGDACPASLQGSCAFPEGVCECASCFSPDAGAMGPTKAWSCARWPEPQGCPTPRPRAGSACAVEGQDCNYVNFCAAVSLGLPHVKCESGVWQEQEDPPPPCAFPQCGH